MRQSGRAIGLVLLLAVALGGSACGARWAYRQGKSEAKKGNWDLAVARLTRAVQKSPEHVGYRIALENARFEASRYHYEEAKKQLAASQLEKAQEELEIATRFDPSNKVAGDDLLLVKDRIREREDEKKRLSQFEAMKSRVQAAPVPVPVLSPRSAAPVTMNFPDQSLEKVFDALGKIAGVNILFDPDFRDKRVTVRLSGVTFQEALDQLTFANRLFYKVLDRNTLIIVPESPAKRRSYEDMLMRTFYIQNADVKDLETVVKGVLGTAGARVFSNQSLNAITIMATVDQLALAEQVIDRNDKGKGEVMVEVAILEVNRTRLKDYGINLANYSVGATFAPTGSPGELTTGFTNIRAHLMASFNLADFVVSVPQSIFLRFLQTDSNSRILAAPRLRAAEGKPTELKIGTEVPVPVTTFTATQAGTSTFAPATSFQYRNVGVTLKLTPRVNVGGEIVLELTAEFSLLGDDRNVGTGDNPITVPTFATRKVEGILRVRDGETSLIGGLVQTRETAAFAGALGLQSLPILNRLFPSSKKQKEDTEILMSITPHLVRAPKVTEADLRALYVGTQEAIRVPSAHPPLFGAPEEPGAPGTEPSPAPTPPPGSSMVAPAPGSTNPTSAPITPPSPPTGVAPSPAAPLPGTQPPSELPPPELPPQAAPSPPPAVIPGGLRPVSAVLSPTDSVIRVGETGTLSLVLMNARDLTALEVVMTYDPATVEATDAAPGTLLTIDGSAVGIERGLEPGRVRVRLSRSIAVAGSGMAATVTFRGLRPGPAMVTVESLIFTTSTGTEPGHVAGPARITVSQGGGPAE